MKKILLFVLLVVVAWQGCQYTELDEYEGGSSIYFSITRDTMKYSLGKIDIDIDEQVLQLPIYLFGEVANYDRTIRLRTELCDTDSLRAEVDEDFKAIPSELILKADTNVAVLDVVLMRTEELAKHNRMFTIVIEEDSWFDSEYNWRKDSDGNPYFIGHSMTVIMTEDFPKPWWWKDDDPNFGFWSYKKADLICSLCDISRTEFVGNEVIPDYKLRYYGKKVQRYLNENPVYEDDGTLMTMGKNAQG